MLQQAAQEYENAVTQMNTSKKMLSASSKKSLNEILYQTERALTIEKGLPRRPWFIHHLYAPGFYTGYGVKTLPGIREAIEQRNWKEAEEQIKIAAGVIEKLTKEIGKATEIVKKAS
jgi:N-acetylated-alpha-linked acidic dipeptidase